MVDFGLQAHVSVGIQDLAACGRMGRAVAGAFSPAQGLARLLAGTRCTFETVDARAFRIVVRPEPPPRARPAPAAPRSEAAVDLVADLTVTTTKRPSLIERIPASVSIATGDTLSVGRIDSFEDLAPEFAGVTMTNLGPGRDKVFVRGLSDGAFTGRTQSTVGLYLDDVPITYNAPDPDLRLIDVERVELMRGPQGSLYGVGSMGGIVRIVTKKPDLAAPEVGAAVGGASTNGGGASYAVDAMVNAPLVRDRLGLRAVAYADVSGGYVEDVFLGVQHANRTRREGGRLTLTGMVSTDWQVTLGVTGQALRSADSQYAQGGLPPLARANRVREPHDNDFTQAYVTVDGAGRWGRLKFSTAVLLHDYDTRADATAGIGLFGSRDEAGAFDQNTRARLAVTEAVLTSPPGGRVQWLAGLFASETLQDTSLDLSALRGGVRQPLYLESRHDRLGETAIYGEATYAITPSVSLTGGLRIFHAWLHTQALRQQGLTTRPFSDDLTNSDLSPKLVLSWQVSPSRLVYLQAAEGYRMPGFNTSGRITQQFNALTTGNQPNRQYRPDKLWNFEAGAKLSFDDRRVELRAAAFYADWRDIQSDQFLPSGLPYTANVGRGVNTGLEAEGSVKVNRALTLRANFLLNGPQLTVRDPTYPARRNASLPAVPRFSGALILDWRREIVPGVRAIAHARLAYIGSSILTFQEQAASAMGDYVSGRLSGGIETGRWRLIAYVDNPADVLGDTFAFGDPFTQGRVRQLTPLRPRTVGLALSMGL